MTTMYAGEVAQDITLQRGEALSVTVSAAGGAQLVRKGDSSGAAAQGFITLPAGAVRSYGPFSATRRYSISCTAGNVVFSQGAPANRVANEFGNVEGFTGNRTLNADDNGRVLRCDDASNVTVTVPADLAVGFNCSFAMWGAGTVTIAAGSGATKRSSTSALSTQYKGGGLIVLKNSDGASAEFVLGGDFA